MKRLVISLVCMLMAGAAFAQKAQYKITDFRTDGEKVAERTLAHSWKEYEHALSANHTADNLEAEVKLLERRLENLRITFGNLAYEAGQKTKAIEMSTTSIHTSYRNPQIYYALQNLFTGNGKIIKHCSAGRDACVALIGQTQVAAAIEITAEDINWLKTTNAAMKVILAQEKYLKKKGVKTSQIYKILNGQIQKLLNGDKLEAPLPTEAASLKERLSQITALMGQAAKESQKTSVTF